MGLLKNYPELFYKLKCNCQCEILHVKKVKTIFEKRGRTPICRRTMNSFEVASTDLITDLRQGSTHTQFSLFESRTV